MLAAISRAAISPRRAHVSSIFNFKLTFSSASRETGHGAPTEFADAFDKFISDEAYGEEYVFAAPPSATRSFPSNDGLVAPASMSDMLEECLAAADSHMLVEECRLVPA